jgi:hypothetical protein
MKLSNNSLARIALAAGISASVSVAAAGQLVIAGQEGEGPVPAPIQCKAAPEAKAPKDIFADADANKDGKLSLDEFNKAYALIIAQEKAKAVRPAPPLPKLPGGEGIIDNCPNCGLG